jgi:hypothetical protein
MKSRILMSISAMTLVAALAIPVGRRLAAQDSSVEAKPLKHHHYKLIDTGTLGGPNSSLGFEGERDMKQQRRARVLSRPVHT